MSVIEIGTPGSNRSNWIKYNYAYNIHNQNFNGRTLQSLTEDSSILFSGMKDFEIFNSFYGQPDYAEHWITAALNGGNTGFKSGYVFLLYHFSFVLTKS